MSTGGPEIIKPKPANEEQRQLVAFFQEMEKKQLDFLDTAAKRIIELTTGLLGVLFAITAFDDDFPPSYLSNDLAKLFAILSTNLYLAAMFFALRAIQPRTYKLYRSNLSGMRKELDKIIDNKSFALSRASILFFSGSISLALLIGSLILSA